MAGVDQFLSVAPTAFRAPLAKAFAAFGIDTAADLCHIMSRKSDASKVCVELFGRRLQCGLRRCFSHSMGSLASSWACLYPQNVREFAFQYQIVFAFVNRFICFSRFRSSYYFKFRVKLAFENDHCCFIRETFAPFLLFQNLLLPPVDFLLKVI